MGFLKTLLIALSALVCYASFAHADDGRKYDVCASDEDAVAIAYELRAVDEGDVAEHGLVINELYAAGKCSAMELNFDSLTVKEVASLTPAADSATRYVVFDIGTGFAVVGESVGEEPMDDIDIASIVGIATDENAAVAKGDLPTGVAIAIAANVICGTAVADEAAGFVIDDGECK